MAEAQRTDRKIVARDALLVALTVSSGAVDAISFLCLGGTFSAFMTGNLVFLGLRLVNPAPPKLLPVLVALIVFAAGSYVGALLTKTKGLGLWPRAVSIALLVAAGCQFLFLLLWVAVSGHPGTLALNVLLALSAFAMGIQTAAVRSLQVPGIFTTAATFTLVALMGDLAGTRSVPEMLRVAGVLLGLVVGAALGAILLIRWLVYAPLLPLAITLAVVGLGSASRLDAR